MTNDPWDTLPKLSTNDGARLPFFPWSGCISGREVRIRVDSEPTRENLQSKHALVEFDGVLSAATGGAPTPYRFAVSSLRLAHALAAIKPRGGDSVALLPQGDGVERTWTARRLG